MGQIGVSRKVDPEEAIDTTARRGRIQNSEKFDNNFSKDTREKAIDHITKIDRYSNDTKELIEDNDKRMKAKLK